MQFGRVTESRLEMRVKNGDELISQCGVGLATVCHVLRVCRAVRTKVRENYAF